MADGADRLAVASYDPGAFTMTFATICGTRGSTTAGMARTLASTAACRRAKSARMYSRCADSKMPKPVVLAKKVKATSDTTTSGKRQSDDSQATNREILPMPTP